MTNPQHHSFGSARSTQLSHNRCDVKFYSVLGDTKPRSNFLVSYALG